MSVIKQPSNNRAMQISLAAGGMTLLCGLGYLAYANHKKNTRQELDIPRETVLKILKEFRREFYPVFKALSMQSMRMQNELKARYQVPAEEIKQGLYQQLVEENPTLRPQIQEIEDRVYSKYDVINRVEFERLCVELARTDRNIQTVMLETKDLFKRAISGMLPPVQMELPASITAETTLALYRDTVKEVATAIGGYVRGYLEEHGSIGLHDENFQMGMNSLNIDEIRSRLIRAHGFDIAEDFHPQQVFTYAVSKFARESPFFSDRSNLMERINQEIIQGLLMGASSPEKFERDLERIDAAARPDDEPIVQLAPTTIEDITTRALLNASYDLPENQRSVVDILENQSQQENRSRKGSMLQADDDNRSVRSNRSDRSNRSNRSNANSQNKTPVGGANSRKASDTHSACSFRDEETKSAKSGRQTILVVDQQPVLIVDQSGLTSGDIPLIFVNRDDSNEEETMIPEQKNKDDDDIKFEEHPF